MKRSFSLKSEISKRAHTNLWLIARGFLYCTESRAKRLRPPRREDEAVSALSPVINTWETWPPWVLRSHLVTPPSEPPLVLPYRWLATMQDWELSEPPTNPIMSRCRGRYQPTLPLFLFVHLFWGLSQTRLYTCLLPTVSVFYMHSVRLSCFS